MNYLMRMKILKRVCDLFCDGTHKLLAKRLVIFFAHELLQIATRHGFHNNTVHILNSELLFEAHYVGTVFASRLQLDFFCDPLSFLI